MYVHCAESVQFSHAFIDIKAFAKAENQVVPYHLQPNHPIQSLACIAEGEAAVQCADLKNITGEGFPTGS